MQAPQQCISLKDWKVYSPLEASGLTFHKLQSCFPFLLIFSFQRSFNTHTHTHTQSTGIWRKLLDSPTWKSVTPSVMQIQNLCTKIDLSSSEHTHLENAFDHPSHRSRRTHFSRCTRGYQKHQIVLAKLGAWAQHLHATLQSPALDRSSCSHQDGPKLTGTPHLLCCPSWRH